MEVRGYVNIGHFAMYTSQNLDSVVSSIFTCINYNALRIHGLITKAFIEE